MEETLRIHVDAHRGVQRHGSVGKRSLPRIILYRVCHGKDFFWPPPSTHTDCSDSNKTKQRIEFENKLFR